MLHQRDRQFIARQQARTRVYACFLVFLILHHIEGGYYWVVALAMLVIFYLTKEDA